MTSTSGTDVSAATERVCPVCGGTDWYDDWPHPDHRYSYCEQCDWPPPIPMSPEEYRAEWQATEKS